MDDKNGSWFYKMFPIYIFVIVFIASYKAYGKSEFLSDLSKRCDSKTVHRLISPSCHTKIMKTDFNVHSTLTNYYEESGLG